MELKDYEELPARLPVLIEDTTFMYPFMIAPIFISDDINKNAVQDAIDNNKLLVVAVSKKDYEGKREVDSFFNVAVAGNVMRKVLLPDGRVKVLFQGLVRVSLDDIKSDKFISSMASKVEQKPYDVSKCNAELSILRQNLKILSKYNAKFPIDLVQTINENTDPNRIADLVSSGLSLGKEKAFDLFNENDISLRLFAIIDYIKKEIENYKLQGEINKKVNKKLDKNQKDYYLKEQLKTIQAELGDNQRDEEMEAFKKKLKKLKKLMPKNGYKELEKQIDKLSRMHPDSSDASTTQTYIEEVLDIPFGKIANKNIDIKDVKSQLDKDHYSLYDPKDRILEFFAVKQFLKKRAIKEDAKSSAVLCFVGPPGVGKTSLANSIAKALKRPLVRIALGGIDDTNELRGHRRTYVGAMPGRIIAGLKSAKKMNPVIVLDEIDKIGNGHRGDPSSVMLEILDPEQNDKFRDLYVNFDIDLSKCIFIATANNAGNIPAPLRDRMEFIQINSYTPKEKYNIAVDYLIPQEMKKAGLTKKDFLLEKKTIEIIIDKYTREAGVRNLRRVMSKLFRKIVKELLANKAKKVTIDADNLYDYLDKTVFEIQKVDTKPCVGVANGLAWTAVGGDVLKIEAAKFAGKGMMSLTGNLGDVMKESARIAFSVVKSNINSKVLDGEYDKSDIHMHIPEGATPKDGPSAGAIMALTIASVLTNRKIRADLAMTGELTLTGKVLPIGGLKEKLIAAYKAKVKKVLIPKKNYERDLKDIPSEVKKGIEIVPVQNIQEVFKHGFV